MVSNRGLFSIICELLWLIEYKLFTNITNIQIFDCKTAKSNFALQKIEYSRIVTNNWNSINGEYELLYCVFWRPLAVFIRRGMVCSFSATPCTYRKTYRCTNKQSDGLIVNRSLSPTYCCKKSSKSTVTLSFFDTPFSYRLIAVQLWQGRGGKIPKSFEKKTHFSWTPCLHIIYVEDFKMSFLSCFNTAYLRKKVKPPARIGNIYWVFIKYCVFLNCSGSAGERLFFLS